MNKHAYPYCYGCQGTGKFRGNLCTCTQCKNCGEPTNQANFDEGYTYCNACWESEETIDV